MSGNGDPPRINPRHRLQECQGCHHIIELLGREQHKLQALTSVFSLRFLFAAQHVLQEWCLACRWTMTPAKGIEKRVPARNETWCQRVGCLGDRHSRSVVSVGAPRSVIEQDSRKRARASWFPEIPLQLELSTRELDLLRDHRWRGLPSGEQ